MEKPSIREIVTQLNKSRITKATGIYILYQDDEIVYVGQSKNIGQRVYAHLADNEKSFNYCAVYECADLSQHELNCLEAELIIEFLPKYNGTVPPNDKFKNLSGVQRLLSKAGVELTIWKLKKWIRENNISPVESRQQLYRISDFAILIRG